MKEKKLIHYFIVSLISLIVSFLIYQEITKRDHIVVWSKNTPLSWDNFTSSNWVYKNYHALLKTGIRCEIDTIRKIGKAFAYVNSKKSFYLDTIKLSNRMLKHEQYHFHISEYHARLLRKDLIDLGEKEITQVKLTELLSKHVENLDKMQEKYDSITQHGKGLIQQPIWELKIDSLLANTEEYSNNDLYAYSKFTIAK